MAEWAWIDTGIHRNPKVRAAGRDGREVFIWFICANREHEFDGHIPPRYAAPEYLARELQMRVGVVRKALLRCAEAGLIVLKADEGVLLPGFDDSWRPKKRKKGGQVGAVIDSGNESPGSEHAPSPRSEKNRSDQKREEVAPTSGAPSKPAKAKASKQEPSDGQHQVVVDGWEALFKARTGNAYGWRDGKAHKQVEALLTLTARDGPEVLRRARILFASSLWFVAGQIPSLAMLVAHWNELATETTPKQAGLFAGTRGHAPPSDASEFGDGDVNKRGGT